MDPYPTNLEMADDEQLVIEWSDGRKLVYRVAELRDKCPCATCRERRGQQSNAPILPVITTAEAAPVRIRSMKPVGNYAYSIAFSDDHDTGIYTFDLLRQLGEDFNSEDEA